MIALVLALQLVASAGQCNQGTTYDIRQCWGKESDAAAAQLKSTYAAVEAAFRKERIGTAALAASQTAWTDARDKMCAFEYDLYLPGTIAPQLGTECDVRMTRARTEHLDAVLKQKARPREEPISPNADAELKRLYTSYRQRINKTQAKSLGSAQTAWLAYREKWCAIEGGSCLTVLTSERITELEDSWIGEPFW